MSKVLHSQAHFAGRAFRVRVDEVEYAPGRTHHIEIVEHADAVTLLPVDETGRVWLVRQYRHAVGQPLLELPAGTLEPGEDVPTAARRELREEVGHTASRLEKLAEFWLAPGYSTELMHAFLATDLTPAPLPQDDDENIVVERLTVPEVWTAIQAGHIRDAKSLTTLLLGAHRLNWPRPGAAPE